MALSAAKLSVAVRVAARQTRRKANCFCELYLFFNKECSLGPPLGRDRAARTCPRAIFVSQEPLAAQIYCLQIEILVDTHEQLQTPLGMPGTRQLLHLVKQRATGHGPQALMALLPSSSSWVFSIYYDFHILKNKYFIATLSKPAGK